MEVRPLRLTGMLLIVPDVHVDNRGLFLETWHRARYTAAGIDCDFVQDNHSVSRRGTVRGLHYQRGPGQAKLVRVTRGRILEVAVDIRPHSPTFGQWTAQELDATARHQLFLPVGFAQGFQVLSDEAEVAYKTSTFYEPALDGAIRWDDPELGVGWPLSDVVLSDRDRTAPSFAEFRSSLG